MKNNNRKWGFEMKKTSVVKKYAKFGIVLYVVILALAAVVSFSWFIINREVSLESTNELVVTAGNNLEISNDGETWGSKVTIGLDDINFSYPDISGDGLKFYYPKSLTHEDQVFENDPGTLKEITSEDEGYYLEFELYFRTTANIGVFLEDDSYVKGADLLNYNVGVYKDFQIPVDGIAGAARVAFLTEDADQNLNVKSVWVPADKYQFSFEETGIGTEIVPVFKESGEREDSFKYVSIDTEANKIIHNEYTINDYLEKKMIFGNQGLAKKASVIEVEAKDENGDTILDENGEIVYKYQDVPAMINNSPELLTFNSKDGFVKQKLVVRIWIEGTDREAHFAFNGGTMKYKLNFIGIEKDPALTLSQNSVTYSDGKLYYSGSEVGANQFDYSVNGIEWEHYVPGNPLLSGYEKIYVRTQETHLRKSSNYITVDIPQTVEPEAGN